MKRLLSSRAALAAIMVALAGGAGAGGYLIGASKGPDLAEARAAGERAGLRAGTTRGEAAGYPRGFRRGRSTGYTRAYSTAYSRAYEQEFADVGLTVPSKTDRR